MQLPRFFFYWKKSVFYEIQIFFRIKTGRSLIDFGTIFPMQSSEFTKSSNLGNILKNKTVKQHKIFHL